MRENRPSGSEGGVAFGPSLPLSGPFVNPPWGTARLGEKIWPPGRTQVPRHDQGRRGENAEPIW